MAESLPNTPTLESLDTVQSELKEYQSKDYGKDFLAYYKTKYPDDYKALAALLAEDQSTPELDAQLARLDATLDHFVLDKLNAYVSHFDFGSNGNVSCSVENGVYKINYWNNAVGEAANVTLVKKGADFIGPWTVKNSAPAVVYSDLEDASEDIALLAVALQRVKNNQLLSAEERPFVMNGKDLGFKVSSGGVVLVRGGSFADWVDARDPESFVALANARYAQLKPKVPRVGMGDVRVAEATYETTKKTELDEIEAALPATIEKLNKINDPDDALRMSLDTARAAFLNDYRSVKDTTASRAAYERAKQAVDDAYAQQFPTKVETEQKAGSSAARGSSAEVASSAPQEKNPEPQSEEDFITALHKTENQGKYSSESTDPDGTRHMTIHLPTKGDVRWSRIQHFEGKDTLGDPTAYVLTSGGTEYQWGLDEQGTETWVNDGRRLRVLDGTQYEIKAKPKIVASVEPAPVVEPVPTVTAAPAVAIVAPVAAVRPVIEIPRVEYDPELALDADEAAAVAVRAKSVKASLDALIKDSAKVEADTSLAADRKAFMKEIYASRIAEESQQLLKFMDQIDKGIPADGALALKEKYELKEARPTAFAQIEKTRKSA